MSCDERGTVAALDSARAVFRDVDRRPPGPRRSTWPATRCSRSSRPRAARSAAALAVQRQLADAAREVAEDCRMRFRIGIHLGDVMEKADGTVYGDGVNIAARLEGLAEPGGVAVSDAVQCAVAQAPRPRPSTTSASSRSRTSPSRCAPTGSTTRCGRRRRRAGGAGAAPADARRRAARDRVDKPSIAVLPFNNMSGDPEQEFFADGITEDIITELSRFRELFVISRNSSFKYKGKAVEVQKFARELGVQYVVEGSVRKVGKRVRITVQLIDAETDRHLWAERYDRDLEDIFAIQDEVTTLDRRDAAGPRRGGGARPRGAHDDRQHGRLRVRADRQGAAPPQQPRGQREGAAPARARDRARPGLRPRARLEGAACSARPGSTTGARAAPATQARIMECAADGARARRQRLRRAPHPRRDQRHPGRPRAEPSTTSGARSA